MEEVAVESAAEQAAPQWGIYWGSRQRLVSVPRLEIGDAVETVELKIGFNVAYLADGGQDQGAGALSQQDVSDLKNQASELKKKASEYKNQISELKKGQSNDAGDELTPPMPGHWYDEVSFWSYTPIIEKRYTVRSPKDKPVQFAVYRARAISRSITSTWARAAISGTTPP